MIAVILPRAISTSRSANTVRPPIAYETPASRAMQPASARAAGSVAEIMACGRRRSGRVFLEPRVVPALRGEAVQVGALDELALRGRDVRRDAAPGSERGRLQRAAV